MMMLIHGFAHDKIDTMRMIKNIIINGFTDNGGSSNEKKKIWGAVIKFGAGIVLSLIHI